MSPTTNASFEAGCIERPEGSGKEAIHKACVNNRNEGRMMARLMLRMAVVRSQLTIFEARLQISTHCILELEIRLAFYVPSHPTRKIGSILLAGSGGARYPRFVRYKRHFRGERRINMKLPPMACMRLDLL